MEMIILQQRAERGSPFPTPPTVKELLINDTAAVNIQVELMYGLHGATAAVPRLGLTWFGCMLRKGKLGWIFFFFLR